MTDSNCSRLSLFEKKAMNRTLSSDIQRSM